MSDKLHEMLLRDEGTRLTVYDDATGKPITKGDTLQGFPTIGVGRELSKTGLSATETLMLFENDIQRARDAAHNYSWFDTLCEARQAVVVSMIFQMGAGGFAGFSNTIKHIAERQYYMASLEMLNSLWARQTPARAKRLSQMMATGLWP